MTNRHADRARLPVLPLHPLLALLVRGATPALPAAMLLVSGTAAAQSDPAEAKNEAGKTLYKDKNYAAAVTEFQAAIAVRPEGRYYFNLCAALEKTGDFDAALEACDAVYDHLPTDAEKANDLKAKTGARAKAIRDAKKAALASGGGTTPAGGGEGTPAGGGDVAAGGGTPVDGGGVAATGGGGTTEPIPDVLDPGIDYTWSLGGGMGVLAPGSLAGSHAADPGFSMNLHADYLISPKMAIGVAGFLGLGSLQLKDPASEETTTLTIVDVGAALYWHKKLFGSIYFTPSAGVQFSSMQPEGVTEDESFATFGLRGELKLDWVLDTEGKHALSFSPLVLSAYSPATENLRGTTLPSDYGLDKPGTTWAFTVGYSMRIDGGKFVLPSVVLE